MVERSAVSFSVLNRRHADSLFKLTRKIFFACVSALDSYRIYAHNRCAQKISRQHNFFVYTVLNIAYAEAFFVYRTEISDTYAKLSACRVGVGRGLRICNDLFSKYKQVVKLCNRLSVFKQESGLAGGAFGLADYVVNIL